MIARSAASMEADPTRPQAMTAMRPSNWRTKLKIRVSGFTKVPRVGSLCSWVKATRAATWIP